MITHVVLFPGKRNAYIEEYKKLAPFVRQEVGCLEYEIFVDSLDLRFDNEKRDNAVVLLEKWESIEALQNHSRSNFLMEFKEKVKNMRQNSKYELLTQM
ncbi:MAG: antibiotic biosynthesis monooxygenase [Gammaproteobacteria bacterium]|nr:antibiotic biosynthesis monooxygenase [Gammaproteobacteria bacterium]